MSGRSLAAALASELRKAVLKPFIAIRVATPDPVYTWSGRGSLPFDGINWNGNAGLAKIDVISESTAGSASGFKVSIDKVPSELAGELDGQAARGSAFDVILGVRGPRGEVLASTLLWPGTLQEFDVVDNGDTLSVTVSAESRQINQRRPAVMRFTDEYQQSRHPGDKFFEFVPSMPEVPILWAKASQSTV